MQDYVKKYLPEPVKNKLIDARDIREQFIIFRYDKDRFLHTYSSRQFKKHTQSQLDARITFHAHALEKGMSHTVIRLGFGRSALNRLAECLGAYNKLGYPKSSKAYVNALSVLREYAGIHNRENFDTNYLVDIFGKEIIDEATRSKSSMGGIVQIKLSDKMDGTSLNFKELFLNRWSVREYANSPVDMEKIHEAISIAMKSPTICNRQASRVTIITEHKKIEEVIAVQDGMTGYDTPPVLLMVTTDTSAFVHVTERNQVYIDGGLFAMSLLLGLEYVSLAACSLNAMFSVSRDKKMRNILGVPKNENIIMFISVGNFKRINKVPKSFRYTREDISRTVSG